MYITFYEGKQRVNYKMQKDKKEDKLQREYCSEVVSEHSKLQNMLKFYWFV